MCGSHVTVFGRGRKSLLTPSDIRYLALISIRDRRKTVVELTNEFNIGRGKTVSRRTIARALVRSGLYGRVAARKPMLRKANIKKRLKFAKEHVNWTLDQWYQVL